MPKQRRLYETNYNNQGCLMTVIECEDKANVIIEFQDEFKARVHTQYNNFKKGLVKNPFYPSVYGVGIIGTKYPVSVECKKIKEYNVWQSMLQRCFSASYKEKHTAYQNVTCCDEWLYYPNFYEWLHNQPNFDKWYNGKRWAVDKDILLKGNKTYSPETCCLIPQNVNCLFLKREADRGNYPIGVRYKDDGFLAVCRNPFIDKAEELGLYSTPERAFQAYKVYKENVIKQVAKVEYESGNITKECFEAMMNYQVDIYD